MTLDFETPILLRFTYLVVEVITGVWKFLRDLTSRYHKRNGVKITFPHRRPSSFALSPMPTLDALALSMTSDGVFFLRENKLTFVNKSAEKLLNKLREDLLGMKIIFEI